jgi:hypothetical protein
MSRLRLSILSLIAAVVACGVAFAALRSGSDYWRSAIYTITVALLLGAVVLARYSRPTGRAFWFGFAVFGWGGFLLTSNPWVYDRFSFLSNSPRNLNGNLLTTQVTRFLVARIRMGTDDLEMIDHITSNTTGIVTQLLVLAVATVGGLFAVAMKKRARKVAAADSSRRSNVVPSLVILVGLAFAGLGLLDRPAPAYFLGSASKFEGYSVFLRAAGEPSLCLLAREDRAATVFRFLWLPSFDHPLTVRAFKTGNGARLEAVVLDGKGGYEPGRVAIARAVELSESQWKGLERHLEATAFWEMPTEVPEPDGSDGDFCIFEGVKDGRHHIVDRWSPEPAYTTLCRYMLDLTGLKVQKAWEEYHPIEPDPESPSM